MGSWLLVLCVLSALSIGVRWSGVGNRFSKEEMDFQMEVLNGTGRTGLAMEAAMELRRAGIDVLIVGDAEHYRFEESILIDRGGNPPLMKKLSRLLGCRKVILQTQRDPLVDATLVLGRDMIDFEIAD